MKATAVLVLAILISAPAGAQEQAPQPDYSRENLQRFAAAIPEEPERERRIRFYWGAIEFSALGQNWRFLPMLPLSGSSLRTSREWPDPFSLTGTAIATPKRAWRTQRKIDAEMRRIEKSERAKIHLDTD